LLRLWNRDLPESMLHLFATELDAMPDRTVASLPNQTTAARYPV